MGESDLLTSFPVWSRVLLDPRITNAVIAIATLVNLVVALYIGKKTKVAAEAARVSAEAALRAADSGLQQAELATTIHETSHRPFFIVARIAAIEFGVPGNAYVQTIVKNYGSVPLRYVDHRIEMAISASSAFPPHSQVFEQNQMGIIAQGEEAHFVSTLTENWLYGLIRSGSAELEIRCSFPYESVFSGKRYTFNSVHRYNSTQDWFEHVSSSMS
jgi:hypothetical protein